MTGTEEPVNEWVFESKRLMNKAYIVNLTTKGYNFLQWLESDGDISLEWVIKRGIEGFLADNREIGLP